MELYAIEYQYADKLDKDNPKRRVKIIQASGFMSSVTKFYSYFEEKYPGIEDLKIIFCINNNDLNTDSDFAETCQYEDCSITPNTFAYSRSLSKIGAYCSKHYIKVIDECSPEYLDSCDLCGCQKGVN